MNYQIREIGNSKYIELLSVTEPLRSENDALDLISLCWEHEISLIMLHHPVLSQDFFNLKTRTAGNIIQKFINYNVKVAAIIPSEFFPDGRFKEFALEVNEGNHFRMYDSNEEGEQWLVR